MLLGRERERELLRGVLDEARAGRSGVLALVGEAGIGKSSLLEDAAAAAAGMRVLRARGVQSESQIPFAGLFELLRPALGGIDRIPAPQAAALQSALALRPARAEERFAVGAATLSILAAYAEEGPLLVLVDDVHWLDGSSADAILFAVRRLLADPIAVLLAQREGEASLLDGADLPTLRLEGLTAGQAAELLRRESPGIGRDAVDRLRRETAGNPLALLELVRGRPPELELGLDAPPPVVTSVAEAYVRRLGDLPGRARDALALAAATDRGELALLVRAAPDVGVEPGDLEPARDAGLLDVRDDRIEFRHPIARAAVYGAATAELRRRVHRALARALPDSDADRRAWHLALAAVGPDEAASSALAQAAVRARERSAYEVSARAYERAARLAVGDARRGELLLAAADAAWFGGLPGRALDLLAEADRHVAGTALVHSAAHLRGQIALRRGPLRDGWTALLAAAKEAVPVAPDLAVTMLTEAGLGAFYEADAEGMRVCGELAAAVAGEGAAPRTAFFARIAEGMALVLSGEGERGAAAIREAVEIVESTPGLAADPELLVWAALGPLWLREAGAGGDLAVRAEAAARGASAVGVLPHLLTYVAIAHAASDGWVAAQAGFDEAIRLARESGQRVVLAAALARLAWLEARLGREDACRTHAEEALAISRELGVALCELWTLSALGELELGRGDAAAALARFEEARDVADRRRIADVDLFPAPERIELSIRLGRQDEGAALLQEYEQAAAVKGQPWALARAARSRALLAGDDAFSEHFERAFDLHARTPDAFERARTLLAFGARLRRAGRRAESRERLREALGTFEDLGAAPWAEQARAELAATGETARRRDPSSLDELTPQELQVGLLLAQGKTTREAAAALFLSPKTIEYHLRNAYRKLAIHSREELRLALGAGAAAEEAHAGS
jgi:DNA-binding CsgD family transcriptional regulator